MVDVKGADEVVVQRLAQLFKDLGLVHFVYRSDKEPAIRAMFEQAIILSGRSGKAFAEADNAEKEAISVMEELDEDDGKLLPSPMESERILVAVPEHSMPGESQSNGIAERAVQQVEDHLRTLKTAYEARLKARIPMNHPVMHWMVEHASHLLSKYMIGPDGRTGYGRLHGKEVTERICEFGERILHYIPRKMRAKMDSRWKYGIFLGRSMHSDQNFVGLMDGSVTTARAMVRLVPSARWSMKWVQDLVATPPILGLAGLIWT